MQGVSVKGAKAAAPHAKVAAKSVVDNHRGIAAAATAAAAGVVATVGRAISNAKAGDQDAGDQEKVYSPE